MRLSKRHALTGPHAVTWWAGAAFALLSAPSTLGAQVTVGGNVQISTDMADAAHYEHLAGADPSRPERMMACSMVTRPGESRIIGVAYASHDGGRSWKKTFVSEGAATTADPVCEFGLGDTAYFAVLSIDSFDESDRKTLVYRSEDAGLSWTSVPVVFPFTDREYVVTDRTGGRFHGRVYLNGTGSVRGLEGGSMPALTLYRSLDGGRTFNGPVQRPGLPPSHVTGMGNSVVLSDGTVVTLFGHAPDRAALRDERNPLTQPNTSLKVGISNDGGESISHVVTVADWYLARERSQGSHIPRLAVDATEGPFKDRLYAVWDDFRNQRLEVLLAWSADKGRSWSRPVRVVRDDRARPDPTTGPDQLMPTLAVNGAGVVGVAWYDRREHPDNRGWYVRFTASLDGGEIFLPSVRVSSAPNDFGKSEIWPLERAYDAAPGSATADPRLSAGVSVNWFFHGSGHTSGLVVGPAGVFFPVWSDNRTGVSQLWTAPVATAGEVHRNGSAALAAFADVSARFRIATEEMSYDRANDSGSFALSLQSISKDTIRGPLVLRVVGLESDVGVPALLDAGHEASALASPGDATGLGAVLDFTPLLPGGVLAPGGASAPHPVRFQLSDLHPFVEGDRVRLGLIRLDARVLAPLPD